MGCYQDTIVHPPGNIFFQLYYDQVFGSWIQRRFQEENYKQKSHPAFSQGFYFLSIAYHFLYGNIT
jgi:hypothetical protein